MGKELAMRVRLIHGLGVLVFISIFLIAPLFVHMNLYMYPQMGGNIKPLSYFLDQIENTKQTNAQKISVFPKSNFFTAWFNLVSKSGWFPWSVKLSFIRIREAKAAIIPNL